MNDNECKSQAKQFLSQYARMCRVSMAVALQCAVVDDAGPIIQRGIDLLRKEAGLEKKTYYPD